MKTLRSSVKIMIYKPLTSSLSFLFSSSAWAKLRLADLLDISSFSASHSSVRTYAGSTNRTHLIEQLTIRVILDQTTNIEVDTITNLHIIQPQLNCCALK